MVDNAASRHRVLVVDDEPPNRELLEGYLAQIDCEVALASDGVEALQLVSEAPPDLVLLDAMMPRLDGFEVCRRIKRDPKTQLLPVVMVTALHETRDRVRALEAGADDFLAKPVDQFEVVARVKSLLRLTDLYDRLDNTERVIFALARAVEAKDSYTEAHTERVASSAHSLAQAAGLDGPELAGIYRGAMIHDIGKIGVPDAVLLKPGPLDPDEWELMKRHPAIGEEIAQPLRSIVGLLAIIRHHHENVDGTGYPDGLRGDDIPISARIVAICDAYDAITSDRPYRSGKSVGEANTIMLNGAGTQWEAALVSTFLDEVAGSSDAPAPLGQPLEPARQGQS